MKMATGYDNDFVEPTEDYECPLCLHVTRDPTLTACCGQHFCQTCINTILIDKKPCPLCKEIGFNAILDKKQKRKVLELKVSCSMMEQGCQWIGELGELDKHLDTDTGTCRFVNVTCPNKCGRITERRFLAGHLSFICLERAAQCKFCGYNSTFAKVTEHTNVCPKYPVSCPNKCQADTFERYLLKQHLEQCPLQQIECMYKYIGCEEKFSRQDRDEHMQEWFQHHMAHVARFSLQTHQKISEAQKKIEKSEHEIQSLQKRVNSIEISSMLPPVEFRLHDLSKSDTWGDNGLTLYTHPGGYKVYLQFMKKPTKLQMKVSGRDSEYDNELDWPSSWIIDVTVYNQAGAENHLRCFGDLKLAWNGRNSKVMNILSEEHLHPNPRNGVLYLKEDSVHIKIDLKKK